MPCVPRQGAQQASKKMTIDSNMAINQTRLLLPWPPSVNRYWRRVGTHVLISREGRQYRRAGIIATKSCDQRKHWPLEGSLSIDIEAAPPDRRRRDLDNLLKALLDMLHHAGGYNDDYQVADLRIRRVEPVPHGTIRVLIKGEANENS